MKTFLLLPFLSLAFVFQTKAAEERPPNFIIIFADDLGYGDLSCFGSEHIRTPRIDAMAKEGMKFTDFYAQPICGPSRAALMTGCYPFRCAEKGSIKRRHPALHSKEITMAEVLKEKGYATGCFGKWDLAGHSQTKFFPELMPNHQGFDYFFGTPSSNDAIVALFRNEERLEAKADMATLTKRYTDEVIEFMRRNKEKPFLVYLPHTMPHTRLDASEKFKGKSKRGIYGDVVEEIDFSTGRIIDAVKEMGLEGNTYVMFTSDNGPWAIKNKGYVDGYRPEDHGGSAGELRSAKVSTFEGGVRVPTVLWGPGNVPAGAVCDKLACTLDLMPTFAALAGAEVPKDREIDGEDIQHLLKGDFDKADPDKVYYYYVDGYMEAVRQGKWKLFLPRPDLPYGKGTQNVFRHLPPEDRIGFPEPLLIDLENDLSESKNLADQHPEIAKRLLAMGEAMRKDIGHGETPGKGMRFYDPKPEKMTFPLSR